MCVCVGGGSFGDMAASWFLLSHSDQLHSNCGLLRENLTVCWSFFDMSMEMAEALESS